MVKGFHCASRDAVVCAKSCSGRDLGHGKHFIAEYVKGAQTFFSMKNEVCSIFF